MGITATVLDPSDMGSLERVLQERQVSLYFSESPTNPCAPPPPRGPRPNFYAVDLPLLGEM